MEARLTEFSYGYCVTEELANGTGAGWKAAPYFPSLYREGKNGGGFDVKIGSALFLQFKLCEELRRCTALETQQGLLEPPFFRFWLHRRDRSAQHQMLISLESQPGNQVYYMAPRFADVDALDQAYRSDLVVQRSAIFSPTEIGPLPDNQYHRIAFRPDQDHGWFLSKPKRVPIHHKWELFDRAGRKGLAHEFRTVEDWLRALAAQMIAIHREYVPIVIGDPAKPTSTQRDPLEELAYFARTHYGCELFLLAEPSAQ